MSLHRTSLFALSALWWLGGAQAHVPAGLETPFASLQEGRSYQLNFPGNKTRRQLRDDYLGLDANGDPDEADPAKAPHLQDAIDGAVAVRNQDPDELALDEHAQLLAWEALEGFLLGQHIAGNFSLLEGLRVAFPENDNPERPKGESDLPVGCPGPSPGQEYTGAHLKHLCYARSHFFEGITVAIEFMNTDRTGELRATDRLNTPLFPHYTVFNSEELPDSNFGDDASNIQTAGYLLGNALDRFGMATVGMGTRLWHAAYFDYNRAPGQSRAGERQDMLDDAVTTMQAGVHAQFLAALPLAATMDDGEGFGIEDAYQICRLDQTRVAAASAASFIARVQAGELPTLDDLSLDATTSKINRQISDVKYLISQVEQRWSEADQAIWRTKQADAEVIADAQELRDKYAGELTALTGVAPGGEQQTPYFGLTTPEGRHRYEEDVLDRVEELLESPDLSPSVFSPKGSIGLAILQIRRAMAEIDSARNRIERVPQQIQIEKDRVGETNDVILGTEDEISAYRLAQGIANSVSLSATVGYNSESGWFWSASVTFNPGAIASARFQNKIGRAQVIQQVEISNRNLEAAVRNLLLQQHQLTLDLEAFVIQTQIAQAEAEQLLARMRRLLENIAYFQSSNNQKWYSDPALLFEQEIEEVNFQNTLRECKRELYILAKLLEGRWGEPYSNPFLDRAHTPTTLGSGIYDDFTLPESIFNAHRNEDCANFFGALRAWDSEMRDHRGSQGTVVNETISLRHHILGLSGLVWDGAEEKFVLDSDLDAAMVRRFQAFLLEHVPDTYTGYQIWFPFSLTYGQTAKFANEVDDRLIIRTGLRDWNHRIGSLSVRIHGNNVAPASGNTLPIEIIQDGRIQIVRYRPTHLDPVSVAAFNLPLHYGDPAVTGQSPYFFPVQAGLSGHGPVVQLTNEPTPFCDRYILAITDTGATIHVERITDIEIKLAWASGVLTQDFTW